MLGTAFREKIVKSILASLNFWLRCWQEQGQKNKLIKADEKAAWDEFVKDRQAWLAKDWWEETLRVCNGNVEEAQSFAMGILFKEKK